LNCLLTFDVGSCFKLFIVINIYYVNGVVYLINFTCSIIMFRAEDG